MHFLGKGDEPTMSTSRGNLPEITEKLDTALTSIFNEDGKRTVLYYLVNKYGLTLEQASEDPQRLEGAFTGLLGEVGWMVVKRAILEAIWERKVPRNDVIVVERASLKEVFSSVKVKGLLSSGIRLLPGPAGLGSAP